MRADGTLRERVETGLPWGAVPFHNQLDGRATGCKWLELGDRPQSGPLFIPGIPASVGGSSTEPCILSRTTEAGKHG